MMDSALGMIESGKYDKDVVRIFIRRVAETNIIIRPETREDELYELLDCRKEGVVGEGGDCQTLPWE